MNGGEAARSSSEPGAATEEPGSVEGFVLLMSTLTIHRASCSSLPSPTGSSKGSQTSDPEAIYSKSLGQLQYALLEIEGAVHACAMCDPGSDPEGFRAVASYAAIMRKKLDKLRKSAT